MPTLLSLLIWIVPWGDDVWTGYQRQERLTLSAALILLTWYGLAASCAYWGFRLGSRIRPAERLDQSGEDSFYRLFSILALFGVVYTYGSVVVDNASLLSDALETRTFNNIRYAVPYEAGIQTLRYASIVSGAIAAYRLIIRREIRSLHLMNLVLLLLGSAIASRLSLVLAGILLLALIAHERKQWRVRLSHMALIAIAFFLITTPLNYVRNAGFYERYFGVTNAAVMNAYEIIAYLGGPFQVSVGVANNAPEIGSGSYPPLVASAGHYILPTYLPINYDDVVDAEESYRGYVDVTPNLTTNSVFATMFSSSGAYAFALMPLVVFATAVGAGHLVGYRSYVFLAGYVLCYCFAEFWRVYLFNYGFVHFLVFCFLLVPLLDPRRMFLRGQRLTRQPA